MPKWAGAVVFFGVAAAIWTGVHVYLYTRVAMALDLGSAGRAGWKGLVVGLALAYLAGRLLESRWDEAAEVLIWVGAVWMGFAALAASTFVIRDLGIELPSWVASRAGAIGPEARVLVGRWGARAALAVAVGGLAWGMATVMRGPSVTDLEVGLKGLPARLDGFKVVQVSDIHIGETVDEAYVDRIASLVDGLDADLVLVTGDLTDLHDGGDGAGLRRLAAMKSRYGVFASTGNHEAYAGGQGAIDAIERAGMPVLRQSHKVIADGIVLAGVDDPTFLGGRDRVGDAMASAVAGAPAGVPVILMSHQPVAVERAAELGVGLLLCGHTHGGQLPPFQALNRLAYRYIQGLHRVGETWLYVNRGAGYWGPPVRVFAPPEVLRVTLRPAG